MAICVIIFVYILKSFSGITFASPPRPQNLNLCLLLMWIFKPPLTLILSINILHSIYEACIYICFLFNIEMKLYNTSILSTKPPLPSACPFLSPWPDRESWYFKLPSAIICGGTSMSGPWVLARKLSPRVGVTESLVASASLFPSSRL